MMISQVIAFVVLVSFFKVASTSDDPLPTKKHLSSKPDVNRIKMGVSRDHEIEHRERHGRMPDSATEVIRELLHYYNRHEAPLADGATVVRLGVYINSFYSINEQTMDYSVSMYLRQSWKDPRLEFSKLNSRIKQIRMAENSWNEIWIPDTFFRNEKGASFHEVTVKNRLLRLSSTGDVWYVAKISAVLSCPMHLQRYPLDTQSCPMMFESFGYTMDTMYFAWLDIPVDIEEGLQLPQFTLVKTNLRDCSQNYTAGAFPCLEIRYILQRDIGYFLIQVYVPSVLIVILSWVSFWINVDASPARVSIGLLTVLTTTTMSGGARATLPRVSYIKAIDVWMISCLIFVFSSLIEYAVVNVLARRQAPPPGVEAQPRRGPFRRARKSGAGKGGRQGAAELIAGTQMAEANAPDNDRSRTWVPTVLLQCMKMANGLKSEQEDDGKPPEVLDGKFQARRVDKFSRRCFPLSFILFNLVYWTAYTVPYGSVPDAVA